MKADSLTIGLPYQKIVDGMRETRQYNIVKDEYFFRWDTIINGKQEIFECTHSISKNSIDKLAEIRASAREYFERLEK